MTQFSELVTRAKEVVGKHREWFDLVAKWYKNAKTTKKVVLELWVPAPATCRVVLRVNGQYVVEIIEATGPFWVVPPSSFRMGDNDLILWIDRQEGTPVLFGSVAVEHAGSLPTSLQQETRPHPQPTTQVSATFRLGEGFRLGLDRWTAHINKDTLTFQLHLEDHVPEGFSVGVAARLPGSGYTLNLELLWKLVEDEVKKQIQGLVQELIHLEREGSSRKHIVEQALEDLKEYQGLHRSHLEAMVHAPDSATLEEVVSRIASARKTSPRQKPPSRPPEAKLPQRSPFGSSAASIFVKLLIIGIVGAVAIAIALFNGWIDEGIFNRIGLAFNKNQPKETLKVQDQQVQLLKDKGAKTGEVQVSLFWSNKNDLDLHVICPSGERIFHGHRDSKCSGHLDVDMNVNYAGAAALAVENVYWPEEKAPRGRYTIIVKHYANHGKPDCQDPTAYNVRLVVRGVPRWFNGEVVHNDPKRREVVVHEFEVN